MLPKPAKGTGAVSAMRRSQWIDGHGPYQKRKTALLANAPSIEKDAAKAKKSSDQQHMTSSYCVTYNGLVDRDKKDAGTGR